MFTNSQDINDEENSSQHTQQCEWNHQASKVGAGLTNANLASCWVGEGFGTKCHEIKKNLFSFFLFSYSKTPDYDQSSNNHFLIGALAG